MSSLIPDGVIDDFKLSEKAVSLSQIVRTTNSGDTWATGSETLDSINNDVTMTDEPAGNVVLVSYTSKNPTLTTTNPIRIVEAANRAIGSNSHSIYKGNMLVDGKIQVGTGVGLEGKVLEDNIIQGYDTKLVSGSQTIKDGELVYYDGTFVITSGDVGIYRRLGDATFNGVDANFLGAAWALVRLGGVTTPKHSTINLDNTSDGHKHIIAKGVDSYGMVYDVGISEGLIEDTGFGDNNEFNQLTNGTLTDLNGNTVRTIFSARPTGKFYKGSN